MKIHREFMPADRYVFDFKLCNYRDGWAQIDTDQDASYFGNWANPFALKVVTYCEGDVTVCTAETEEEFAAHIEETAEWTKNYGYKFAIDGMCQDRIISEFNRLGLGHFLH